jgi:hypothetical protein
VDLQTELGRWNLLAADGRELGLGGFGRLGRWLGEWSRHDLRETHWHLVPLQTCPDRFWDFV